MAVVFFAELWSNVKIYVVYYFMGGFGGVVCLVMMSRRLRFLALLKAFFVASFGGLMGGCLAKSLGWSLESQAVAAGLTGFVGGLGILFLVVIAAKKFGIDVQESIKDAIRLQDAMTEVNENIIHGPDAGICPEKPVENGLLTALVFMEVITEREAQGICCGSGETLLLRLLESGNITKDQHARILATFVAKKKVEDRG